MQKLVQIIYISRSTFENTDEINKIEPNVIRILAKSRINNRRNGLVGVLYFGDAAFFQCLEGTEEAIETLFAKLEQDPRHKDIKILSKKYISKISFPNWAMKYALFDEKMGKFLKENGYQKFDPYAFTSEMTQKVLELLVDAQEQISDVNALETPPAQGHISKSNSAGSDKRLIMSSLILSAFACVLAAAALLSARGLI